MNGGKAVRGIITRAAFRTPTHPCDTRISLWVESVSGGRAFSLVGIEPARASCRCRVTALALSVARRVHNSTMAAFRGAPR
jgi:hypothetical protein